MKKDTTIENIIKEFAERNDCIVCYGRQEKPLKRLREILQTERQKREEMVEEGAKWIIDDFEFRCSLADEVMKIYDSTPKTGHFWFDHISSQEVLASVFEALTQPNNPN